MIRVSSPGLQALQQRLSAARATWQSAIQQASRDAGAAIVEEFRAAAPKGKEAAGSPVAGDTPGPLSESFQTRLLPQPGFQVITTQPGKLTFVRKGTGIYGPTGQRIVPRTARALYWPGAAHPYRSVAGQKANDFITPLLVQAYAKTEERMQQAAQAIFEKLVDA